jgi:hypothetical protein
MKKRVQGHQNGGNVRLAYGKQKKLAVKIVSLLKYLTIRDFSNMLNLSFCGCKKRTYNEKKKSVLV